MITNYRSDEYMNRVEKRNKESMIIWFNVFDFLFSELLLLLLFLTHNHPHFNLSPCPTCPSFNPCLPPFNTVRLLLPFLLLFFLLPIPSLPPYPHCHHHPPPSLPHLPSPLLPPFPLHHPSKATLLVYLPLHLYPSLFLPFRF